MEMPALLNSIYKPLYSHVKIQHEDIWNNVNKIILTETHTVTKWVVDKKFRAFLDSIHLLFIGLLYSYRYYELLSMMWQLKCDLKHSHSCRLCLKIHLVSINTYELSPENTI